MAAIILRLDERSLKRGKAQVRMRIAHKNTQAYIGMRVYVSPLYFTSDPYCPILSKERGYKEKTEQVAQMVRKFESAIFDLERAGLLDNMTAPAIKGMY